MFLELLRAAGAVLAEAALVRPGPCVTPVVSLEHVQPPHHLQAQGALVATAAYVERLIVFGAFYWGKCSSAYRGYRIIK